VSWLVIDYPFGGTVLAETQNGFIASVPADSSAASVVTFMTPFPNACSQVLVTISTTTPGLYELSAQVSAVSVTGFSVTVAGGAPGSTVSVYWEASGS
jgi:hypothetical protein